MCGQIPGSHCIPVTEIKFACGLSPESFQARYGFPKPESNDALVVCCKTGVRSKTACDLLEAKGYNRHRIYRGSFTDWEEKGGDVIKPGQPYFCDCEDEDDNTNLKNAINQNQIKDSMIPGDQRFSDTDDDDDDKENIS
ncbi:Thiosulfate sulfurtransferase rdl2, mitochondrial [Halocaridina rubra]|uniref:Thiosulfate sulfurtransferase rdl2, mitochondrial n=1 Tax=Halocaridina rubra TaxID=373956 RepID=A0AAN8WN07_HALRR